MQSIPSGSGNTLGLSGTQLVTVTSSKDYKENITGLNDSSWIYKLNGKQFNFKGQDPHEHKSFGWIAEDVDTLNPDMVVYQDGKPYSLLYAEFLPFIVEEMKKHEATIKNLQKLRVQDTKKYENNLYLLTQRIKSLESKIG